MPYIDPTKDAVVTFLATTAPEGGVVDVDPNGIVDTTPDGLTARPHVWGMGHTYLFAEATGLGNTDVGVVDINPNGLISSAHNWQDGNNGGRWCEYSSQIAAGLDGGVPDVNPDGVVSRGHEWGADGDDSFHAAAHNVASGISPVSQSIQGHSGLSLVL